MRVTIQRQTIQGEIITGEVDIEGAVDAKWASHVAPLIARIDARMIALNKRVLDANKELGNLDDHSYNMFRNLLAATQGIAIPDRSASNAAQAQLAAEKGENWGNQGETGRVELA